MNVKRLLLVALALMLAVVPAAAQTDDADTERYCSTSSRTSNTRPSTWPRSSTSTKQTASASNTTT